MIAPVFRPVTDLHLLGVGDQPWIAQVIELAMASRGVPWRVLLERVSEMQLGVAPVQLAGITDALRRSVGRAQHGRLARALRGQLLGHPAVDPASRAERVAAASTSLGITPAEVDRLLWADLAQQRPVELPGGRPSARGLAADANLLRIQRAVRRAHELELQLWGKADPLVRLAASRGLLVSVRRALEDSMVLDVVGPCSLRQESATYGRELAALIPRLAAFERFALELRSQLGEAYRARERTIRVATPALLPAITSSWPRASRVVELLARDLIVAGCSVERQPPPLASGRHVLFPDLAIERRGVRWWLEVIGYSTPSYLGDKVARYRAAGITNVVLCVDDTRREPEAGPVPGAAMLPFTKRINAQAVVARMEAP